MTQEVAHSASHDTSDSSPKSGVVPSSGATSAPLAAEREDKMPAGIPYIVANEFAERFCYYGINAILTVYMTNFLGFGQASATSMHSLFKASAYFFPVVGAIVSDVFWGKYRTIMTFSLVYATGCAIAAFVPGTYGLFGGLLLVAFGTGGIKPCVSTNVGDQFTSKNQHLIERAFSYFYLAINAGSSISIFFCPVLLEKFGPAVAFGVPAGMMFVATAIFFLGRKNFAVVPPAGKAWLRDVFSKEGLKIIGSLAVIYFFVACFWMLWDQSNGQTWTLQAESSLMDKDLGFGLVLLPAQIQVVNGLFILAMVPIFTFGVYPLMGKFFKVTPLRKIGIGLFTIAASFLIVARIEARIQAGQTVSVWWQILAYVVLTASEVLVSITALEFSYKQAPLRMKSFIMSLFLLSTWLGNMMTAGVNQAMVKPLHAVGATTGEETWITLQEDASKLVPGQKVDFENTGIGVVQLQARGDAPLTLAAPYVVKPNRVTLRFESYAKNILGEVSIAKSDETPKLAFEAPTVALAGTYLVAATDPAKNQVKLMDVVWRQPLVTRGRFHQPLASVNTYYLVGPQYFNFFAAVMAGIGVVYIFFAMFYREKTHVRDESEPQTAAA